jgi:CheY-like chemotaxis protein
MTRVLLFIDDDIDVRDAFGDLLEYSGWTVVHAADGLAALEWLAKNEPPAAILLDLKMPRCDGYEFRARQLADPRWRDVPTVVFTADANADGSEPPILSGAPLLRKSAPFAELRALLEHVVTAVGG